MWLVILTDGNGQRYPSVPFTIEDLARQEFERGVAGRFVAAELMYGNPVNGFKTIEQRGSYEPA